MYCKLFGEHEYNKNTEIVGDDMVAIVDSIVGVCK